MFEAPLTSEQLETILSSLRRGLEQILGDQLEAVYLYGSQARGDARPDSDIDILIVLNLVIMGLRRKCHQKKPLKS